MNLEIGTDIEEITRFREKPYDKNKGFYEKVFTENEILYCMEKADPYQHFAVRFCAKEAVIKALQNKKVSFNEIEVINEDNIPKIKINLENFNEMDIKVSLSHTKNYAVAYVIVVKN
ncbi:holo-ACP synthase [Candidatus Woesearchaeota archaeon]|jgi:holo-[acyl-carrier protein] synthase|nr:holo-ACP synthase [Candidatus Woesearchaeota archaeon]